MEHSETQKTLSAVWLIAMRYIAMHYGGRGAFGFPTDDPDLSAWLTAFCERLMIRLADVDGPVRPTPEDRQLQDSLYWKGETLTDETVALHTEQELADLLAIEALARELHPAVWPLCEQLCEEPVPRNLAEAYFGDLPGWKYDPGVTWGIHWETMLTD